MALWPGRHSPTTDLDARSNRAAQQLISKAEVKQGREVNDSDTELSWGRKTGNQMQWWGNDEVIACHHKISAGRKKAYPFHRTVPWSWR